jgi:hypothetical protein
VDKIGEGICSNYRLHELTFWCTLSKLEWALESTEQVFFFSDPWHWIWSTVCCYVGNICYATTCFHKPLCQILVTSLSFGGVESCLAKTYISIIPYPVNFQASHIQWDLT